MQHLLQLRTRPPIPDTALGLLQMRRGQDIKWDEDGKHTPFWRRWVFRAVVVPVTLCAMCNATAGYMLVKQPGVVSPCILGSWLMRRQRQPLACAKSRFRHSEEDFVGPTQQTFVTA